MIYKLLALPGILTGLAFHEFAHAFVSDKLGDPTPRSQGRLTIAPQAHIDLIGFLFIMIAGFGWGRPVMIDKRYYKKPVRDDILVSIAGPLMNILLAFVFCLTYKILSIALIHSMNARYMEILEAIFINSAAINVGLAIFNILPIPPLDGSHVLLNVIAPGNYKLAQTLQQYGMVILLFLVLSSNFGFGILDIIIGKPAGAILSGITRMVGL
ncbi:MAG TPA: site-2 protease family protein [Clostridia bacterium]